jgi:hypothetical protein
MSKEQQALRLLYEEHVGAAPAAASTDWDSEVERQFKIFAECWGGRPRMTKSRPSWACPSATCQRSTCCESMGAERGAQGGERQLGQRG